MKIIAAVAVISTFWYLVEFFLFATKFKAAHSKIWNTLGRPERFGIRGQMTYLLLVFGFKKVPEEVRQQYSSRLIRIQILLLVGFSSFAALWILTWRAI